MNLIFQKSVAQTDSIATFYFKTDEEFEFTAGQFISLTIPHENPDNRGLKRWFTLSSSPGDEAVSITTRLTKTKSSTFKLALNSLSTGDVVQASSAMGDFVLPKLIQTPLIFVAIGIGVTPYLSILQWLADTKESRPIKLIHAVRSEDDIVFQDIFDAAKIHTTIVVSKPSAAWGGVRGHVTAEMILGLEEPTPDGLVYISGPEQIVEALKIGLLDGGLRKDQIVGDYFPGYTDRY